MSCSGVVVSCFGVVVAAACAKVARGPCVWLDRRDGAVIVVMGGVFVHVVTLPLDGSGDIGAAP
jgi:hypothetical protein